MAIACALQPRLAEARGPSTLRERAQFVALVRALETDPLADNANATRQRLQQWIIDVPDIRFKRCPALLVSAVGDDYPYAREINLQVVLSGAVLTIENPGAARDDVAVYMAGAEGALRAYEALTKSRPDAHAATLDDLIERRNRRQLLEHIARLARENCKASKTVLLATPIGAAVGLVLALLVAPWVGRLGTLVDAAHERAHITATTATISRRVVLISVAYYMTTGIALHILEPEYDPRFQFMSDYAWGAYGWLMTSTFFVLGLAILAVTIGLRNANRSSRNAGAGLGLLIVGAVFVCLAGVFRGFPMHDVASAVAFPSLALAVLLVSWSFRTVPGWQRIHQATFLLAVGMSAALVPLILDVGMPGLQQRTFLLLLLLWLSVVVCSLDRPASC